MTAPSHDTNTLPEVEVTQAGSDPITRWNGWEVPDVLTYNPVYDMTYPGVDDPSRGYVFRITTAQASAAEIVRLREEVDDEREQRALDVEAFYRDKAAWVDRALVAEAREAAPQEGDQA